MPFKHGRLAEIWLGGQDVSTFFMNADLESVVETAPATTFKALWKSFLAGLAMSRLVTNGYFDSTLTNVRATLGVSAGSVVTFAPAGAVAIGDLTRSLLVNSTKYKEGAKIGSLVTFDWDVSSTAVVAYGVCLHVMQSESPGTITGTGDGVMTSAQSTTGAIATLHVTAYTSGTHSFKLQDATTQGGAYTDIASGAFTNVTAVGAQRLVIPGTIRQFVRAVATINTSACTYGITVART